MVWPPPYYMQYTLTTPTSQAFGWIHTDPDVPQRQAVWQEPTPHRVETGIYNARHARRFYWQMPHEKSIVGLAVAGWANIARYGDVDAIWIWQAAKEWDGLAETVVGDTNGTTLFGAMEIGRRLGFAPYSHTGHNQIGPASVPAFKDYRYLTTVDHVRAGVSKGPACIGFPWFTEFDKSMPPRLYAGSGRWIGSSPELKWGNWTGEGAAGVLIQASDRREAFRMWIPWGEYFDNLWISYRAVEKLLKLGAEAVVGIDWNSIRGSY